MSVVDYKNHKEIPLKYRKLILEEMLVTRVSKVSLRLCNQFIQDLIDAEESNSTLLDYEVEVKKGGQLVKKHFTDYQSALVEIDRVLEFGESRDTSIVIALRQAKHLVRAYVEGEWIELPPRDQVRIISRSQ